MGGLKATFLTDYLHTTIALILLLYFSIAVLTNEHIGGLTGLYEKAKAAEVNIVGNYQGSLLTMKSRPCKSLHNVPLFAKVTNRIAVLFGIVLKFGNLALVLMDTAFWQKSFASEVHSTVPAYGLVSIVILAIPWCTGTIIGLAARAIEHNPIWFNYPNVLTLKQVNSGLVMPYVLRSLLGKGATNGLLVLIFMAITSTVSSSMIAVSSIISLDGYRTYFNPKASDRRTLQVSHWGVVFHGTFMAGFAIMLQYAGATNLWSTYFRPVMACPGIIPMILTLFWSRQTKAAAILGPLLGLLSGLATWLSLSWYYGGAINITTTQTQLAGLYGAVVSFFSPLFYSVAISLIWPSKFDWREFLRIDLIEDENSATSSLKSKTPSSEVVSDVEGVKTEHHDEKRIARAAAAHPGSGLQPAQHKAQSKIPIEDVVHPFDAETIRHIKKWLKISIWYFIVNFIVTCILWPLPLYRNYIFTRSFFDGWVVMALM